MAKSPEPLTVLLADARDIAGAGLFALLNADTRFRVALASPDDVLRVARAQAPQLVILDPRRADQLDLEQITALATACPTSCLCLYTDLFEPRSFLAAMRAGVQAYFLKASTSSAHMADALALVGRYQAAVIDQHIVQHFRSDAVGSLSLTMPVANDEPLSERERTTLLALAAGASDKEIAQQLQVGRTTVETYILRLRLKLGAETRAHLIAIAARRGLLNS